MIAGRTGVWWQTGHQLWKWNQCTRHPAWSTPNVSLFFTPAQESERDEEARTFVTAREAAFRSSRLARVVLCRSSRITALEADRADPTLVVGLLLPLQIREREEDRAEATDGPPRPRRELRDVVDSSAGEVEDNVGWERERRESLEMGDEESRLKEG